MPTKNKISRKPVNELGIAIQGYEGSFHQVAARTIFGNEVEGVSDEVLAICDGAIEIPQYGMKHSLNISVAAAIVLWEMVR